MVHLTKTLSNQVGQFGITVNCIHPGTTRTERTSSLLEARAQQLIGEVEEQAEVSREEMDIYTLNMLRDLERRLQSHLSSIQRGVLALDEEAAAAADLGDEEPV